MLCRRMCLLVGISAIITLSAFFFYSTSHSLEGHTRRIKSWIYNMYSFQSVITEEDITMPRANVVKKDSSDPHEFEQGFLNLAKDLVDLPNDLYYGSHQVPLLAAVYVTEGAVLEMGCGHFSTPLLHNITAQRNRFLLTADTSSLWLQKLRRLMSGNHRFMRVAADSNFAQWADVGDARKHWGLVFVDHMPAVRRKIDLHRLNEKTDIFVVHDTEYKGYKYDFSEFKYVFTEALSVGGAATTVVGNSREDLIQQIEMLVKLARQKGIR